MKVKYSTTSVTFTHRYWFLPFAYKDESPADYIGRVAKFARDCFGLTQAQVAKQAKLTQPYISRIESGKWQSIKKVNHYLLGYGLQMNFEFAAPKAQLASEGEE